MTHQRTRAEKSSHSLHFRLYCLHHSDRCALIQRVRRISDRPSVSFSHRRCPSFAMAGLARSKLSVSNCECELEERRTRFVGSTRMEVSTHDRALTAHDVASRINGEYYDSGGNMRMVCLRVRESSSFEHSRVSAENRRA